MNVSIDFYDEQEKITDSGFNEEKIKAVVEMCMVSENLEFDCEVGVTFTDNEGIRGLNREHREIDRETDVLSFPMLSDVNDICELDKNPENGLVYMGDIVISLEKAKEQSEEYGHSFEREIAYLLVHSMMHLCGYDHIEDSEKTVMREHEEAVLSKLGILR